MILVSMKFSSYTTDKTDHLLIKTDFSVNQQKYSGNIFILMF